MKIQLDVMGNSSSVSSHHIKYICEVNEGENDFSIERFWKFLSMEVVMYFCEILKDVFKWSVFSLFVLQFSLQAQRHVNLHWSYLIVMTSPCVQSKSWKCCLECKCCPAGQASHPVCFYGLFLCWALIYCSFLSLHFMQTDILLMLDRKPRCLLLNIVTAAVINNTVTFI